MIYELEGTLIDRIIEILVERLAPRIEEWEAEEIAAEIVRAILGE
jgi:hypothetical protein